MSVTQPRIQPGHGRIPRIPTRVGGVGGILELPTGLYVIPKANSKTAPVDLNKSWQHDRLHRPHGYVPRISGQRRQAWQKDHDFSIIAKVTRVAEKSRSTY
jgi:hypothetical protein